MSINENDIIELHSSGKSCSEIARIYNCNPETIRKRLIKLGVDTSIKNENPTCIYCDSTTQKVSKTKYGVNRYKCVGCQRVFNDNTIKESDERKERNKLIVDLYLNEGKSTTEIGNIFNLSATMIGMILKELGLIRSISEAKKGKKRGSKLPKEEIIELYKSGKSSTQVAEVFDISKTSVIKVLKEFGIDRDNDYIKSHDKIKEIEYLYLNGLSMNMICKELNIPYSTVNFNLHKLGIVRTEDKNHIRIPYDEWLKLQPEYKKYKSKVIKITNQQPIQLLENFKKRGNSSKKNAYHLDHKFSIVEGFKQGIDPDVIGDISNLEFIPWRENISKGFRCSITIEELLNINE